MAEEPFDVIVVGGGLSGLCAAGELLYQGKRPLLICETKEVGLATRSHWIDGNRVPMQEPVSMIGWGGPWWPGLVRRLNVPVRIPKGFGPVGYVLAVNGVPDLIRVPQSVTSAADMTSALCEVFPPLEGVAPEFERIMRAGIEIPYQELLKMHDVPLAQWLEDLKADELVSHFMFVLAGAVNGSTSSLAFNREQSSVFGVLGCLRTLWFSEAICGPVYPDIREGLCIPLAQKIEELGGCIWRGRRVAEVAISTGRVGRVVLEDGTEVAAPDVVVAVGTSRITTLLDATPPELEGPMAFSAQTAHKDFQVIALLDEPVIPNDFNQWLGVVNADASGMAQYMGAIHNKAPWGVKPDKQVLLSVACYPEKDLAEQAEVNESAIVERMHDCAEVYFPGYRSAIREVAVASHKPGHLWFGSIFTGPKTPMSVESVDGLWFVGEGVSPSDHSGMFTEAAASAGILGARRVVAKRGGAVR